MSINVPDGLEDEIIRANNLDGGGYDRDEQEWPRDEDGE